MAMSMLEPPGARPAVVAELMTAARPVPASGDVAAMGELPSLAGVSASPVAVRRAETSIGPEPSDEGDVVRAIVGG